MDEKIVNPVEEATPSTEPVIEIPEAPVAIPEETPAEYKPKVTALIMGIVAIALAGIGGFLSLLTPIGSCANQGFAVILAYIPCIGTIIAFLTGVLSDVALPIIAFILLTVAIVMGILSIFAFMKEKKQAAVANAKASGTAIVGLILGIIALIFGGIAYIPLLIFVLMKVVSWIIGILGIIATALLYVFTLFASAVSSSGY